MRNCPSCSINLSATASFCHQCGHSFKNEKKPCPNCRKSNPEEAVFCISCGHNFSFKSNSDNYEPQYRLDFDPDTLMEQIRRHFFRALRKTVIKEQSEGKYSEVLDRFYHSDFLKIYTTRSNQLGEKTLIQWETKGKMALPEIDALLSQSFESLIDYFLLHFCQDLLKIKLPESILKYEKLDPKSMDKWTMIRDFLDFQREPEVFYFDFITTPQHFLENAAKNFLKAERKEKLYFICDLSFKGNLKDGFAMTDHGIYWKQPFHKAHAVKFKEINSLEKTKDGLKINGRYFTANPSLDLKLLKLLKKLKKWPSGNFSSAQSVA